MFWAWILFIWPLNAYNAFTTKYPTMSVIGVMCILAGIWVVYDIFELVKVEKKEESIDDKVDKLFGDSHD